MPSSRPFSLFPARTSGAVENMALDCALAGHAGRHRAALVRFYRFATPSITLGRFQDAGDLAWDAVRAAGIAVSRRPSGGRALLHGQALTWAVALPFSPAQSRRQVFTNVMEKLVAALAALGTGARLAAGSRRPLGPSCFDSLAEWELADDAGRKIAPAAQAVGREAVLLHGILPLDDGYTRIAAFLAGGSGAPPPSGPLAQAAFLPYPAECLEEALLAAFDRPAALDPGAVATIEMQAAASLAAFRVADPAGPEYPLQAMPVF